MSHEYIDVYCIIMSFFILIDYVFAIVCANIKPCNSTTKNPLGIALKKSCQFSCDFLASTKEWMRRGLEALRSLFAHVELCLYQWPCPPMLLLLKRHTDKQLVPLSKTETRVFQFSSDCDVFFLKSHQETVHKRHIAHRSEVFRIEWIEKDESYTTS